MVRCTRHPDTRDRKIRTFFLIALYSLLFVQMKEARAELFTWTDENGIVHISDDSAKMPVKERMTNDTRPDDTALPADRHVEENTPQNRGNELAEQKEPAEKTGAGPGTESLIQALKTRETAADAALALGRSGDERAVDPLIELLFKNRRGWSSGRDAALQALTQIGSSRGLKALISVLDDEDLAYNARNSLLQSDNPQVIDLLKSTLHDENEYPRIVHESGRVLSEMGKRGVEPLMSCLQNTRCACAKRNGCGGRSSAAYFLGQTKDPRAIGPLIEVLNERIIDDNITNSMHAIASRSLLDLTGQNFGADYAAWKKWQAGAPPARIP